MSELNFVHFREEFPGVVTACYRELDTERIEVGFSFCNPNDQFSKKIGRYISQNRLVHMELDSEVVELKGCEPKMAIYYHLENSWVNNPDSNGDDYGIPRWMPCQICF